jgi:hypothetical protein
MPPEANGKDKSTNVDIPEDPVKNLTVEEMYDKEKYDLSTMKEGDVFKMLEYVIQNLDFSSKLIILVLHEKV